MTASTRPSDWTDGADLESLLRTLDRVIRLGIRTVIPGRLLYYDAPSNTATVEVGTLQVLDADDPVARARLAAKGARIERSQGGRYDAITLPSTVRVPVLYPGGSGGQLTFPLQTNCKGILLVFDRGTARWVRGLGAAADPGIDWTHLVSDSIFVPRWPMPAIDGTPIPATDATCLHQRLPLEVRIGDTSPTSPLPLVPAAVVGSEVQSGVDFALWAQSVNNALAGLGVTLPPIPVQLGRVSTGSAQVKITGGTT